MEQNISVADVKRIVGELRTPRPAIYWTDLLLSVVFGGACFFGVQAMPLFSPQQILCFIFSGLLYFRAVLFIHELIHLPHENNVFRSFRVTWNLLCGIPFLVPSFTYWPHLNHHRGTHFGTPLDGEYLPFANSPPSHILCLLAASFAIPPLAFVRFFVLTPLSWCSESMRKAIHRHASSLVINPRFVRPEPTPEELRIIRWQEFACIFWCLFVAVVLPIFLNDWFIPLLIQFYASAVFVIMLNALRTLGAHRYRNDGRPMSFVAQALDSVTYPYRAWISGLWGPLGLRYHALHHLQPMLPYHAMAEAHRRLMRDLPEDSLYRFHIRSLVNACVDRSLAQGMQFQAKKI